MIRFKIKVPRKLKKKVKKACYFYGNKGTILQVNKRGYMIDNAPCAMKGNEGFNK